MYLDGFREAQKILLDDSLHGVDESINIDKGSDSDDEDSGKDDFLQGISDDEFEERQHKTGPLTMHKANHENSYPVMQIKSKGKAIQNPKTEIGKLENDKNQVFKPKKKGFGATLTKAFKNLF